MLAELFRGKMSLSLAVNYLGVKCHGTCNLFLSGLGKNTQKVCQSVDKY